MPESLGVARACLQAAAREMDLIETALTKKNDLMMADVHLNRALTLVAEANGLMADQLRRYPQTL